MDPTTLSLDSNPYSSKYHCGVSVSGLRCLNHDWFIRLNFGCPLGSRTAPKPLLGFVVLKIEGAFLEIAISRSKKAIYSYCLYSWGMSSFWVSNGPCMLGSGIERQTSRWALQRFAYALNCGKVSWSTFSYLAPIASTTMAFIRQIRAVNEASFLFLVIWSYSRLAKWKILANSRD